MKEEQKQQQKQQMLEAYENLENKKLKRVKNNIKILSALLGINVTCVAGLAISLLVSATAPVLLGFSIALLTNAIMGLGFIVGKHIYDKKQNAKDVRQFEETYQITELGAEVVKQRMLLDEKKARKEAQAREIFPEIFNTPTSCKPHTQKTSNKNMENENFENIDDATHTR